MIRKSVTILTVGALITLCAIPAQAGQLHSIPGPGNHLASQLGHSNGVTAGAYIRIPFAGGLREQKYEPRFGLAISSKTPSYNGFQTSFAASNAPKFLDLSIGFSGKQSFRINNQSLRQTNALYAGQDGEDGADGKKKGHVWLWVLGGVVVGAVALVLLDCSSESASEAQDNTFGLPC